MSHPTGELTLDLRQPNDPHFTDEQTEFLKCNAQPAWLSVQAIKAAQTPGLLALRPALCLYRTASLEILAAPKYLI